jgi:hypothetical protein
LHLFLGSLPSCSHVERPLHHLGADLHRFGSHDHDLSAVSWINRGTAASGCEQILLWNQQTHAKKVGFTLDLGIDPADSRTGKERRVCVAQNFVAGLMRDGRSDSFLRVKVVYHNCGAVAALKKRSRKRARADQPEMDSANPSP